MPSVRSFLVGPGNGHLQMQEPPLDDTVEDFPEDAEDAYTSPDVPLDLGGRLHRPFPAMSCLDAQSLSDDSGSGSTQSLIVWPEFISTRFECFRKAARYCLTKPQISVVVLICGVILAAGLGAITFFSVNPAPAVDKSFDAFAIPNHEASKRKDALDAAISEYRTHLFGSSTRTKRDLWDKLAYGTQLYHRSRLTNYDHEDGGHFISVIPEGADPSEFKSRKITKGQFARFLEENLQAQDVLSRSKRAFEASPGKTYGKTQAYRKSSWHMELIFLAHGHNSDNIFTEERLETIHNIERRVMEQKGFTDHCYIDYRKWEQDSNLDTFEGCAPINSLTTYFYPSQTADGMIHYDSLGSQLEDINATLSFAMTRDTFYWYVDSQMSPTHRKSKLLRSEVMFGVPLPGYSSRNDRKDEQHRKFIKFVVKYIDLLSKQSTSQVKVLYGSTDLFDYQVDKIFWNDMTLAAFTFAFIIVFMFILTSFSLWLTVWGMLSIILSFPLALFFYRCVFGVVSLGILNGAAAFVIIGIGVDDVFVFINTFRQAEHMSDLSDRLVHTVLTAGKATLFTSLTSAAAFAANVASSIPAVHEFGLFMSLIVACCWLMVVILMPPVINLWFLYFSRLEHYCYRRCRCSITWRLAIPSDIANFLDEPKVQSVGQTASPASAASHADPDVQLLTLDGSAHEHEGEMVHDDDPLLRLEEEISASENLMTVPDKEGCDLTSKLRALLYHWVAVPVVRARWLVLGGYLVLLAVSVALMLQLHPASKPPQMFDEDTNLQRLVDLAANVSNEDINCDLCSGFYKEQPVTAPPVPTILTSPWTEPPIKTTGAAATSAKQQTKTTTGTGTSTTKETSSFPTLPLQTTSTPTFSTATMENTTPVGSSAVNTATREKTAPTLITTTTAATTTTPTTTTPTTTVPTTTAPTTTTTTTTTTSKATIVTEENKTPQRFTPRHPLEPETDRPTNGLPTDSPVVTAPAHTHTTPKSADKGYNPCDHGKCDNPKERPNLELGAAIYVVFGIKDVKRTEGHVISEDEAVYDQQFQQHFNYSSIDTDALLDLCQMCHLIANNTQLVKPGGSQCIPSYYIHPHFKSYLKLLPKCRDIPENTYINGKLLPSSAKGGFMDDSVKWLAMSFESTTYKGQSYFDAYSDYQDWEAFIQELKEKHLPRDSPLQSMYQTSDFWKEVMMEIVAVSSAIYGLVLSMIICVAAVALFTGHVVLLLIVMLTLLGMICMVVSLFYLAGWELGAVEAVSLSILVGTSVDYCVHLVEGYLLAGRNPPSKVQQDKKQLRQWRTLAGMSHIGVSIVSSAITTIIASIPLTQTIIRPFSKFGQIVAINTTVSIFYTLTACAAFLAAFAPARFKSSCLASSIALLITACFIGVFFIILYGVSRSGMDIPGPNGQNLFSK